MGLRVKQLTSCCCGHCPAMTVIFTLQSLQAGTGQELNPFLPVTQHVQCLRLLCLRVLSSLNRCSFSRLMATTKSRRGGAIAYGSTLHWRSNLKLGMLHRRIDPCFNAAQSLKDQGSSICMLPYNRHPFCCGSQTGTLLQALLVCLGTSPLEGTSM